VPLVCIHCGTALPTGPEPLHTLELDPERFPNAAQRFPAFRYHLCASCRKGLPADARPRLEDEISRSLDVTSRLQAFLERHIEETTRSVPGYLAAVEAALSIHEKFQEQASGDLIRLRAYLACLQPTQAAMRELLGREWLDSLSALCESMERAQHESTAVSANLHRRLEKLPPA
jgi:hypothetical protein